MDKKEFDWCVFIGRFQPLHNGHLHVLKQAFDKSDNVLIILGSSLRFPYISTPKNPFSSLARCILLKRVLVDEMQIPEINFKIEGIPDYFNTTIWANNIIKIIKNETNGKIAFIDHIKEIDSYFKKLYDEYFINSLGPNFKFILLENNYNGINASEIRERYFLFGEIPKEDIIPKTTKQFLENFVSSETYKKISAFYFMKKEGFFNDNN